VGEGPSRTAGARVFNAALYLLSYLGESINQRAGWASTPRGPVLQTRSDPTPTVGLIMPIHAALLRLMLITACRLREHSTQ
jgi:hypothetical protein